MNPEVHKDEYPAKPTPLEASDTARELFSIPAIRWDTPPKPCEDIVSELTTDPNGNNHRGFWPTVIMTTDWPYDDDIAVANTAWFNEQTARRMQYHK